MFTRSIVSASTSSIAIANSALFDDLRQPLAVFALQLFGVAQPADAALRRQDDGGGHHRPEESATPYFVHTGNHDRAGCTRRFFVAQPAVQLPQHAHLARRRRKRFFVEPLDLLFADHLRRHQPQCTSSPLVEKQGRAVSF